MVNYQNDVHGRKFHQNAMQMNGQLSFMFLSYRNLTYVTFLMKPFNTKRRRVKKRR